MKQLANPEEIVESSFSDTNIRYVNRSYDPPSKNISEIIEVSVPGNAPIYMWFDFDDHTIYFKSIVKKIFINVDSANMFFRMNKLENINISFYYTASPNSSKSTMMYMFFGCNSLTSIDLSNFDTSNVTDMNNMFHGCKALTSLDLSNFNTSNVTAMTAMFKDCLLTSLDVSNFNTSNLVTMNSIFNGCKALTSLDVSNWNTSKVVNMGYAFGNCSSLTSLDVSNWDTSKVRYIQHMFDMCSSLTQLNLSSWDTSSLIHVPSIQFGMMGTFNGCTNLSNIVFSDKFIIPDDLIDTLAENSEANGTYRMYARCPANKPTGGNWDLGAWTEDGTFLKNA